MTQTILGGSGYDYAATTGELVPAISIGVGTCTTSNTPFAYGRSATLSAAPDNHVVQVQGASAQSEIWLHTWIYRPQECWLVFYDGTGNEQCSILITPTLMTAYRGYTSRTSIGTASYSSIGISLVYFQVRIVPSTSAGIMQVFFDLSSTPTLNLSGVNNQATGNANVRDWATFCGGFAGPTQVDDSWLTTQRSVGYLRSYILTPDQAGSLTQFATLSGSGSQYQAIQQVPNDGDTTYIADSTANRVTLVKASAGLVVDKIMAIRPLVFAKRMGSAGSMAVRTVIGGYAADRDTASVGTGYGLIDGGLMNTNPDTSAEWLRSDIANLEFGPKVISATGGDLRATLAGLEVVADTGQADNSVGTATPGGIPLQEAQFLI